MLSTQLFLTGLSLLLCQAQAGYFGGVYGGCAGDCIAKLPDKNCTNDDFTYGWDCVCSNATTLNSVNGCITSSCSSSDQKAIFGDIAQACANKGTHITAAPAEATFSATSGGSLWATGAASWSSRCTADGGLGNGKWRNGACGGPGWGGPGGPGGPGGSGGWGGPGGRCAWTSFTGNWGGWLVSWSGYSGADCSTTATTTATSLASPATASATITRTRSASLGATVVTTVNGQTLTGTIFSAQGDVISTAGATATAAAAAAQNNGVARTGRMGACAAMVIALVTAIYIV